jgi:hypothetical protein
VLCLSTLFSSLPRLLRLWARASRTTIEAQPARLESLLLFSPSTAAVSGDSILSYNAAGIPTFDLDKANRLLVAKKMKGIEAPPSAPAGPEGTGAVDWLYLVDAGGSRGVSTVYRVLTAGGTSHGCKARGVDSASYTAMYWFYG